MMACVSILVTRLGKKVPHGEIRGCLWSGHGFSHAGWAGLRQFRLQALGLTSPQRLKPGWASAPRLPRVATKSEAILR